MTEGVAGGWAAPFFAGRRVLVTGGASGIGLAIAAGFAEAGAEVTATGLELPVDAPPAGVTPALLDVRDSAAIEHLLADHASLDVVVNCAGTIRRGEELQPDVFAEVIDINLTGSMRVCAAARPLLACSRGAIVNMASMLSFFGGGLVPGYAASKGGVVQMTKSLAIAYAAEGIRVNALAPGWIRTSLTRELQEDEARESAILARTPLQRWGKPADIAAPALFLASPLAGFITGAVLPVDGGYASA